MGKVKWTAVWRGVLRALVSGGAPVDVVLAALDDGIRWRALRGGVFRLEVPDVLRRYMERGMDDFAPLLKPFIKSAGCETMVYKTIKTQDQKQN